jgi:ABC-type lipoprotein release transport system permease subunit
LRERYVHLGAAARHRGVHPRGNPIEIQADNSPSRIPESTDGRYIATLLYEVKATDVSSLVAPVLALIITAILAALPPIVRAVRIDPVKVLRSE